MNYHCSQHQCVDCQQKTTDAGGMIFRCRWCERGYCEDCLDWDKTELLGENLKEYELLGFPAVTQAFYICCPSCTDFHQENHDARDFCRNAASQVDEQYKEMLEGDALMAVAAEESAECAKVALPPSRDESLTDATTLDCSGISTPQLDVAELFTASGKPMRKAAPQSFKLSPSKRSMRLVD